MFVCKCNARARVAAWACVAAGALFVGLATATAQSPPGGQPLIISATQPAGGVAPKPVLPEVMGPPSPPPRPGTAVQPAPAQPPAPGSDIPAPTVVLKPGEMPKIAVDMPVWNFGRVQAGPEVAHDFWFTNTGNGPLEILKVRPG